MTRVRGMRLESASPSSEDCVSCQLSTGLGMMIDLCKIHKFNVNCEGIKEDVLAGKIGFEEAYNVLLIKAREKPASWNEFDQVIKVMEKAGIVK